MKRGVFAYETQFGTEGHGVKDELGSHGRSTNRAQSDRHRPSAQMSGTVHSGVHPTQSTCALISELAGIAACK
jgi:hypothetical protein